MDVKVIDHEMPLAGGRIAVDGATHVRDEISFGAGRSARRSEYLAGRYIEVDEERAGAVAFVLELVPRHFARSRRKVRRQTFQRLHPGQFVSAPRSLTTDGTCWCAAIDGTHVSDLDVVRCPGFAGGSVSLRGWSPNGKVEQSVPASVPA